MRKLKVHKKHDIKGHLCGTQGIRLSKKQRGPYANSFDCCKTKSDLVTCLKCKQLLKTQK